MRLLAEMLGSGGLTVSCATADGIARARLTLQANGSTFLRCTTATGLLANAVGDAMIALSSRIAAACDTLAALRTAADAAVFAGTLAVAAASAATAELTQAEILRPLLVFAVYAVLIPLRGTLLRLSLRWALRVAGAG